MEQISINNEIAYKLKCNDNYYITKTGILYSIFVKGAQGKTDINNPRKVMYGQDKDGYYRVVLSSNGEKKYVKIHTLVAEQFIGEIDSDHVVNHIDGNKHNNNVDNLEIITPIENTKHAWRTGLARRENNPNLVNVIVYDNENNQYDYCLSIGEVTRKYNIPGHYIRIIRKNDIYYDYCLLKKIITGDGMKDYYLECYYNGKLVRTFNDNDDAAKYFGKKNNTISQKSLHPSNKTKEYNRYTLTFPNVSTIESIA